MRNEAGRTWLIDLGGVSTVDEAAVRELGQGRLPRPVRQPAVAADRPLRGRPDAGDADLPRARVHRRAIAAGPGHRAPAGPARVVPPAAAPGHAPPGRSSGSARPTRWPTSWRRCCGRSARSRRAGPAPGCPPSSGPSSGWWGPTRTVSPRRPPTVPAWALRAAGHAGRPDRSIRQSARPAGRRAAPRQVLRVLGTLPDSSRETRLRAVRARLELLADGHSDGPDAGSDQAAEDLAAAWSRAWTARLAGEHQQAERDPRPS